MSKRKTKQARKQASKEDKSFEFANPLVGTDGGDNIEHKIGFFKYCHERIDELKASLYQRASVIMVVLAFIVVSFMGIADNILDNYAQLSISERCIFLGLSIVFWISFVVTAFFGIGCLIPASPKTLEKIVNKKKDGARPKGKIHAYTSPKLILKFDYEDYKNAANQITTSEDVLEELVHGVYSLSTITDFRYDLLSVSYRFLLFNILSFVGMIAFLFVIKICM